jgi:hypothetical protein
MRGKGVATTDWTVGLIDGAHAASMSGITVRIGTNSLNLFLFSIYLIA